VRDGGDVCAWFEYLERMEEEKLYVGRGVLNINAESCSVVCINFMYVGAALFRDLVIGGLATVVDVCVVVWFSGG
jgi:hypothetical protein